MVVTDRCPKCGKLLALVGRKHLCEGMAAPDVVLRAPIVLVPKEALRKPAESEAPVAQRPEHPPVERKVAGSTPAGRAIDGVLPVVIKPSPEIAAMALEEKVKALEAAEAERKRKLRERVRRHRAMKAAKSSDVPLRDGSLELPVEHRKHDDDAGS